MSFVIEKHLGTVYTVRYGIRRQGLNLKMIRMPVYWVCQDLVNMRKAYMGYQQKTDKDA